jgi:hypothetical protein
MRKQITKVEQIIYEIEHSPAGYTVRREGTILHISHSSFARPLPISIGRFRPGTIIAALDGYREAIEPHGAA